MTTTNYKLNVSTSSQQGFTLITNASTVGGPQIDIYDATRAEETVISSTDGTTVGSYIASYLNHPLLFGAYASVSPTAKMVVATSGNVGIGVINPLAQLHINETTSGAAALRVDGTNGTLFSVIDDLSDSLMSVNNSAGLPVLEVFADDRVVMGQYGANDLVVRNNKVGIGTVNPGTSLEIYATPATSTTLRQMLIINTDFASASGTGFGGSIVFRGRTAGNLLRDNAQISAYNEDAGDNGYALGFFTRPSDGGGLQQRMTIARGGNVGIGTNSPGALLNVNGRFMAGGATSDVATAHILMNTTGVAIQYTGNTGNYLMISPGAANTTISLKADARTGAYPPMDFWTSNTSRMTILANGNVGINNTNPVFRLDVNGTSAFRDTVNIGPNIGTITWGSFGGGSGFGMKAESGRPLSLGANGNFDHLVINTSGNVGIGTTNPSSSLHVSKAGNSAGGTILMGVANDNTAKFSYLVSTQYNSSSNAKGFSLIGGYTDASSNVVAIGGSIYEANPATELQFYTHTAVTHATGGTRRMTINTNGNVGIGTVNPLSKLAVDGVTSVGPSSKLSLIGLDINSGATPTYVKIVTTIPFASPSADFTVNIKGFVYGAIRNADISISWHYYLSTFYNPIAKSSGGWAPTIRLSAEGGFVAIVLSSPGYWPKFYVESMYSSAYSNQYSSGWSWVDADATGSPIVNVPYASNFGNNFVMLTDGNVGIGTTAPAALLQINSGTPTSATRGIQFGDDTGTRLYRSASGIITCSGTIAATFSGNLTGNATNVTGTVAIANGGTGATTAANARTNLGATTVGANFFTLTNPSAITFPRINADNTVSALDAATFRTAIGAGTGSGNGTVTSVGGTGTVSGLTLTGTVTTTGNLTLGGTLSVTASNFASQTANTFLAAPNGAAGVPTFRTIVAADVPTLNQNTTGSSTFVASLGVLNYDNDRTTKRAGLSHYTGYSTGTNRPTTYDYTLQVTNGTSGWEISMDWIATTGPAIYARSLRDCCQNWSSWVRILDSANYSFAANMNQNVRTTDGVTFAGITGNGQLNINHSTPTAVARLWSGGSTVWSLGVGDASGSYFNISADFGSFTINKTNGYVGIGTTSQTTRLQLGSGTPTASADGIQFGGDTSARLYRSSSGVVSASNSFSALGGFVYASNYLQTGNNLIYPASFSATQRLEVGNAAQNAWITGISIAPGGNVVVAGTLTESSSIRYKENVQTIIAPILPKLNNIRTVTYNKKDNPKHIEYGIIAEELNELFPEFVNKNESGEVESVNYSRLTVILIKAVKELQEEVEKLKNK
jgi:hypothetical protein